MPGAELRVLLVFFYLFLTMTLLGASYFYLHFIDKETRYERESNKSTVTQPVSGRSRFEHRQPDSRSHHVNPITIPIQLALVWEWCCRLQKLRIIRKNHLVPTEFGCSLLLMGILEKCQWRK